MFLVWFACNTCRGSFQKLDDFLTHKKQHHFEEFQNTKCIIFEERIIQSIEQTVLCPPTPQYIEKANPHGFIDPPKKVKVKNENDYCNNRTNNQQLSCQSISNVELFKTEHQSSGQDIEKSAHPVKELAHVFNPNLENTNAAASKLNTTSANGSDFGLSNKSFIRTLHNQPVVLVKRLTSQEIQNLTLSSENASIVKSFVKPVSHATLSKENKCSENTVSTFSLSKITSTEEANVESKKLKKCENSPGMDFLHDSADLQNNENTSTNNEENGRPKRARPFECQYCGASFFQKYAIAEHLTWHATEETFKCIITQKYRKIPKTKNNFRLLTRIPSRTGNKQKDLSN